MASGAPGASGYGVAAYGGGGYGAPPGAPPYGAPPGAPAGGPHQAGADSGFYSEEGAVDEVIHVPRPPSLIGPILKAVAAVAVVAGAVWLFNMVAGGGGMSGPGGPLPVIQAEPGPDKMRPDDPGGMEIPHQERLVYEQMGRDHGRAPVVERLLPPPEMPLPPPTPPAVMPAPADPALAASGGPVPGGAYDSEDATTGFALGEEDETPDSAATAVSPNFAAVPVSSARPAAAATTPAGPSPRGPTTPPKPVPATASVSASVPAAPVTVPASITEPASGERKFLLQIASVRTQDEALKEWQRLQRRHADVLGGLGVSVVRVDLGDKGVYYRVRAGKLDEKRAKDACAVLGGRQVGCHVVQ